MFADGTKIEMTDTQEALARKHGLRTFSQDNGDWGWSADVGEDWDFDTEQDAWKAGMQALEE